MSDNILFRMMRLKILHVSDSASTATAAPAAATTGTAMS